MKTTHLLPGSPAEPSPGVALASGSLRRARPAGTARFVALVTITILFGGLGCDREPDQTCSQAVVHMTTCYQAFCEQYPDGPVCSNIPAHIAAPAADCSGAALAVASDVLTRSCEDLTGSLQTEQSRGGRTLLEDERLYTTDHLAPDVLARRNMRGIFDSAIVYYERNHLATDGSSLNARFPESTPLTPATIPCGEPAEVSSDDWQHPSWRALGFTPASPLHYSYQFQSSGTASLATFTVTATSDLDCDGVFGSITMAGSINANGRIQGVSNVMVENDGE